MKRMNILTICTTLDLSSSLHTDVFELLPFWTGSVRGSVVSMAVGAFVCYGSFNQAVFGVMGLTAVCTTRSHEAIFCTVAKVQTTLALRDISVGAPIRLPAHNYAVYGTHRLERWERNGAFAKVHKVKAVSEFGFSTSQHPKDTQRLKFVV